MSGIKQEKNICQSVSKKKKFSFEFFIFLNPVGKTDILQKNKMSNKNTKILSKKISFAVYISETVVNQCYTHTKPKKMCFRSFVYDERSV